MYYPIIDKLKVVIADITSVKDKEPLVIVGTITSETGGTWVGDFHDIINAFRNNKPVYFKVQVGTNTFIIPVISLGNTSASSSIIYFNNMMVYGSILRSGEFNLNPVQS